MPHPLQLLSPLPPKYSESVLFLHHHRYDLQTTVVFNLDDCKMLLDLLASFYSCPLNNPSTGQSELLHFKNVNHIVPFCLLKPSPGIPMQLEQNLTSSPWPSGLVTYSISCPRSSLQATHSAHQSPQVHSCLMLPLPGTLCSHISVCLAPLYNEDVYLNVTPFPDCLI